MKTKHFLLESQRTKLFERYQVISSENQVIQICCFILIKTKIVIKIIQEMKRINDQYRKELWFDKIDRRITFKQKVHNWFKESKEKSKSERLSRGSSRTDFKSNSTKSTKSSKVSKSNESKSSKLSKVSFQKKLVLKNVKLANQKRELVSLRRKQTQNMNPIH